MSPNKTRARSGCRSGLAGLVALGMLATPLAQVRAAEPERFTVDASRSHLRLVLDRTGLMKFLGHEHHIEAPVAAGQVEIAEGDPARSSVKLRFDAGRLFLIPGSEPADDIPKVEERMRGPEVLEVAKYPEIVFASTSVKSQPEGGSRFRLVVSGALTLKGRSFPVAIPLEASRVDGGIDAKGEVLLNLSDIGIEPPSVAGVVKVANRFKLEFEIHSRP
jgi:polyisoprenoid-binding protein YceI